jgi:hypothetical protein
MSVFMAMIAGLKTEVVARCSLALENVALRQQLAVLERSGKRPKRRQRDRVFWVLLSALWPAWHLSFCRSPLSRKQRTAVDTLSLLCATVSRYWLPTTMARSWLVGRLCAWSICPSPDRQTQTGSALAWRPRRSGERCPDRT